MDPASMRTLVDHYYPDDVKQLNYAEFMGQVWKDWAHSTK